MIRYLPQTPPSVHLLVLVLAVILRLPAFWGDFYQVDEELAWLAAVQSVGGGDLYIDAWFSGPPLVVWVYQIFVWIFGSSALTALRIFSIFWVYLLAISVNGFLAAGKVISRFSGVPAVLMVLFTSTPWQSLELGGELLAVVPLLLAFQRLLDLGEQSRGRNPYSRLFTIGLLAGIAILFSYKSFFMGAGLVLAFLILRTANLPEFFTLLMGIITPILGALVVMYIEGNLMAFREIGFEYYWQRVTLTGDTYYPATTLSTLQSMAFTWGVLLVLVLVGFFHYRTRFFSLVARIRSIETVMAVWLVMGLVVLVLKFRRLEVADFAILAPPLSFYASVTFSFKWPRLFRLPLLIVGVAAILVGYLGSITLPYPALKADIREVGLEPWVLPNSPTTAPLPTSVEDWIADKNITDRIWIADHQPQWYRKLGVTCDYPYLDFRMVFYKFEQMPGYSADRGIVPETDRTIYEAFSENPPLVILDPHGYFEVLRKRYPTIFGAYRTNPDQPFSVYLHPTL